MGRRLLPPAEGSLQARRMGYSFPSLLVCIIGEGGGKVNRFFGCRRRVLNICSSRGSSLDKMRD